MWELRTHIVAFYCETLGEHLVTPVSKELHSVKILRLVAAGPALEHVLQHGVVGLGQPPRLHQLLQAQQQRAKQSIGVRGEERVAAAGPVPGLVLHQLVRGMVFQHRAYLGLHHHANLCLCFQENRA